MFIDRMVALHRDVKTPKKAVVIPHATFTCDHIKTDASVPVA
jgi:hypothetical protein